MDENKVENTNNPAAPAAPDTSPTDTPEKTIHDTPLEDILAEAENKPAETTPEVKPNEKPAETKPEEKPVETTPAPPTIDTEALTQKIIEGVVDKIGSPETTKEKKDELTEMLAEQIKDAPWVKESRNPTYTELFQWVVKSSAPFVKEQVKADLQADVEEEDKKEAEQKVEAEKEQQQINEGWKNVWEQGFKQLEDGNRIPKVITRNEKDPGVIARVNLLSLMRDKSQERAAAGLPPVTSIIEVYHEYYLPHLEEEKKKGVTTPTNGEPAGAAAPIYGGDKAVNKEESKPFNMAAIHNASVEDIMAGKV